MPAGTWTWRPTRERWLAYLWLGLLLDLLFFSVYGGANLFNDSRSEHLQLFFEWEPGIPLIPAFIYPYFSIFVLFLMPLFALDVLALRGLAKELAVVTVIAGVLFVVLPTRLGFEPSTAELPPLFNLLSTLDLPYNLVPSLHVAYSTLTVLALTRVSPTWLKLLFWLWLGLMCVSVVLVHQHHLLDVVSAFMLALVICNSVTVRRVR
jgi:membrane-associated phospholipid phosphatase